LVNDQRDAQSQSPMYLFYL